MTRLGSIASSLLFASFLLVPAAGRAQSTLEGFAVQGYDPAYAGDGFFASPDAPVTGRIAPAVKLTFSYANRPLRLIDPSTGRTVAGGEVVRDQLYMDLDASVALFDRVKVGIGLPFAAVQSGDASYLGARSLQSSAFADMRVGARVSLMGKAGAPVALAVQADLWLPTGSKEDFAGDGTVRGHPRLVASGVISDRWLYSAALGVMIRSHRDLGMAEVGTALSYSGAAAVLLWNKRVQVGPELFGSTTFAGGASPVEGMIGAKVCVASVVLGAGVGGGFGTAPGAAAVRALASVGWEPGRDCRDSEARLDAPRPLLGDERPAGADSASPAEVVRVSAEDAERAALEARQAEAEAAEEARIAEVARAKADATAAAEAKAAEEARAAADAEAAERAVKLAMADTGSSGGPTATLRRDSIVIRQQVQFERDNAVIKPESEQVMRAVAAILRDHPEIDAVAIEGHTDDSGSAEHNTALSKQRAEAVRGWLIKEGGVEARRLTATGFGPDRPVAPNKEEAGRRANRRVEFKIAAEGATASN